MARVLKQVLKPKENKTELVPSEFREEETKFNETYKRIIINVDRLK